MRTRAQKKSGGREINKKEIVLSNTSDETELLLFLDLFLFFFCCLVCLSCLSGRDGLIVFVLEVWSCLCRGVSWRIFSLVFDFVLFTAVLHFPFLFSFFFPFCVFPASVLPRLVFLFFLQEKINPRSESNRVGTLAHLGFNVPRMRLCKGSLSSVPLIIIVAHPLRSILFVNVSRIFFGLNR